jgi:hypothetical protein
MMSEISSLPCKDLEGLKVPTVLCYVLCLTTFSGFDSHSLRQQVLTAEKFLRPFPRNTRNMPVFRNIPSINRTADNVRPDSETVIDPSFSLEGA